jgi:hypothetical protein
VALRLLEARYRDEEDDDDHDWDGDDDDDRWHHGRRGRHGSLLQNARFFGRLNVAISDAMVGCWDAKYAYFNPRPSQLDPSIKTVIGLPNFPAYTSGHSSFSSAAAVVLSHLFPSGSAAFDAMKEEAGISRLYGAIHYRSDIERGKAHGARIGGYTVAFARQDGASAQ